MVIRIKKSPYIKCLKFGANKFYEINRNQDDKIVY